VELRVVLDADEARLLRPHEGIERDARSLEAVDDPDAMRVTGNVATVLVGGDDAVVGELLDPLERVADQGAKLSGSQAGVWSCGSG
jgi:hypothetical protein